MSNSDKLSNQYAQIMWGKELQESLSGITTILETYQNMLKGLPTLEVMSNLAETVAAIKPYYINTIDMEGIKTALGTLSTINANAFASSDIWVATLNRILQQNDSFTNIKEISSSMSQTMTNWGEISELYSKIFEQIDSIPEDEIAMILEGTEFTKEDVLDDIKDLKEEIAVSQNSEEVEDCVLLKDKWENFLRMHPALANLIFIMSMTVAVASGILNVNQLTTLVTAGVQNAIVSLQGCEDIFFVKVESAKLYVAPDSHSDIITTILYAEQVTQIDSVNLWRKVIYVNPDGKEMEGWMAKKNLLSYQDYQFNSDELSDMED